MANEFIARRGIISLGGVTLPYVEVNSGYNILTTDYFIEGNAPANPFNITLPTAIGFAGKIYVVKNTGNATITVNTTSSQTIDGSLTKTLGTNGSLYIQSNGSDWLVVGINGTAGTSGTSGSSGVVGGSGASITITTQNGLLIDGSTSQTLNVSRTLSLNDPFNFGADRTGGAGLLEYNVPTSDGYASGEVLYMGSAGQLFGFDDVIYMNSSGNWLKVDANVGTEATLLLGIALGATPTTNGVLLRGFVRSSAYNFTPGLPLYVSTSEGLMTTTVPANPSDVVRIVGYCINATTDVVYFNPENTWIVRA